MAMASAARGASRTSGPVIANRAARASRCAASASSTMSRSDAPSQLSRVSTSCALASANSRASKDSRLRRRLARLEALRRDRLHGRERVLHPVIELVDEELLCLFMSALLGAVAEDLQEAAAMLGERKHDAAAPERRAVLAQMPALVRSPAPRAPERPFTSASR